MKIVVTGTRRDREEILKLKDRVSSLSFQKRTGLALFEMLI